MNRRDALKALASVASATGMAVTPVTAKDAEGVELVLIRLKAVASTETMLRIKEHWTDAVAGTSLADAKALVLCEDIDVEFVRTHDPRLARAVAPAGAGGADL